MVFDFWRAPTDNDFGNEMPKRAKVWKHASDSTSVQNMTSEMVSKSEISIKTNFKLPTVDGDISINYSIHGNGQIVVDYSFEVKKEELSDIPRIGMKLKLPKEFDNLNYYGRGPWENYIDRNTSAFVGIYNSKVAKQYFAYSRPQEDGHKTDVRWLSLTNQSGLGLKIESDGDLLEFNALHYSTSDFNPGERKLLRTIADINEGDFVELHIDHKMMGVGGDDIWGAKPHKWKLVASKWKPWELYNINEDRTESNNLIEEHKDISDDLINKYEAWAKEVGVDENRKHSDG